MAKNKYRKKKWHGAPSIRAVVNAKGVYEK